MTGTGGFLGVVALVASTVAGSLPAAAQTAAQTDALVRAIAEAGCVVNENNNATVLQSSGVGEDVASTIVQTLLDDGRAVIEGANLRLKTGGCS